MVLLNLYQTINVFQYYLITEAKMPADYSGGTSLFRIHYWLFRKSNVVLKKIIAIIYKVCYNYNCRQDVPPRRNRRRLPYL